MSSQALCSSKITTGAHSLVGRGFLPWAEFNCFVGLDAVVRFLAWGPRAALLCWGTHMWITAGRAGSDRMAVSDLGARYGWSRDRSSRQPWLPGPVAPRTHGPHSRPGPHRDGNCGVRAGGKACGQNKKAVVVPEFAPAVCDAVRSVCTYKNL